MNFPSLAGSISTSLFMASMLPMLIKAWRTKDLTSYSLANLAISNVANLIHSVYVFSLPAGPIWALHGFYLAATGVMLGWSLRYRTHDRTTAQPPLLVRRSFALSPSPVRKEAPA